MGNRGKRSRERWVPRQEQKGLDKIERRKIAQEEIEAEVRNAFYSVEGECRSCGSKENVLETDKVLTGGRRHKLCQECLDYILKKVNKRRELNVESRNKNGKEPKSTNKE